jgi:membrane dipeptidase
MKFSIFDSHCDTAMRIIDNNTDISTRTSEGHIDLPRLQEGNVRCQVFAAFTSVAEYREKTVARSEKLLAAIEKLSELDDVIIPETLEQLQQLKNSENTGIIIAIEGGEALGGEPARVAELKARGVRYITLAWGDNDLTGSSLGNGKGLTPLGKEVVAEMEKHKVLVDVSHLSDAGFYDLLEITSAPIIASHSNARSLCGSPRNLSDDQIRKIAERGGVIGVNFVSGFLTEEAYQAQAPLFQEFMNEMGTASPERMKQLYEEVSNKIMQTPQPPLESVVDQILHISNIGGIDCVAFGSDFDGYKFGPKGLEDCRDYGKILDRLSARGFNAGELEKLCWNNWERIFSWTF